METLGVENSLAISTDAQATSANHGEDAKAESKSLGQFFARLPISLVGVIGIPTLLLGLIYGVTYFHFLGYYKALEIPLPFVTFRMSDFLVASELTFLAAYHAILTYVALREIVGWSAPRVSMDLRGRFVRASEFLLGLVFTIFFVVNLVRSYRAGTPSFYAILLGTGCGFFLALILRFKEASLRVMCSMILCIALASHAYFTGLISGQQVLRTDALPVVKVFNTDGTEKFSGRLAGRSDQGLVLLAVRKAEGDKRVILMVPFGEFSYIESPIDSR